MSRVQAVKSIIELYYDTYGIYIDIVLLYNLSFEQLIEYEHFLIYMYYIYFRKEYIGLSIKELDKTNCIGIDEFIASDAYKQKRHYILYYMYTTFYLQYVLKE